MAITTQDIHRVADGIVQAGGTPTLAAVRRALGGGSFTTISEAMQDWRSSRNTPAPLQEPAPEAISARFSGIAKDLWGEALKMANSRLQAEREALERARQETEQARREAEELADQVSAELDQARNALAEARAETGRLASQLARPGAVPTPPKPRWTNRAASATGGPIC
jgi:malate synthase